MPLFSESITQARDSSNVTHALKRKENYAMVSVYLNKIKMIANSLDRDCSAAFSFQFVYVPQGIFLPPHLCCVTDINKQLS